MTSPINCTSFKVILTIGLLGLSNWVSACIPHITDDVFIARLQSVAPAPENNQNKTYDLKFDHANFIFRSWLTLLKHPQPAHWQSNFDINSLHPNDLLIGLAYTPNSDEPRNYQVASLAPLSCVNDTIIIGKPLSPFVAWNRKNKSCHHDNTASIGILDGFFDHDQNYYLQIIQNKYPTCDALEQAYPAIDRATLSNKPAPATNTTFTENSIQSSAESVDIWAKFKVWLRRMFY